MKTKLLFTIFFAAFFLSGAKSYSQTSLSYLDGENLYRTFPQEGRELSKEDEEKYLKKYSAEARAKLEEIKKLDKNKYYSILRGGGLNFLYDGRASGFVYDIARGNYNTQKSAYDELSTKQRDAEVDVELAVVKYKKADAASQAKLRTELYNALARLFDIRESYKQEEIKSLEKRLQELKESLNERKQNRDNIVTRRLKELLNERDELRW